MSNGFPGLNDIVLAIVLVVCLYTDIKERKIYNNVVFPGIVFGLAYFTFVQGTEGLLESSKGLGLGIGLLIIPFILGGLGAGDVKLLGAVGALKGPSFLFLAFLGTGLSGGLIAVYFLVSQRKLLSTLKRIVFSFLMLIGSRFKFNALKTLERAEYHEAFPYGLAIVMGTVASYVAG